jgi:signal transduction histidine kinase
VPTLEQPRRDEGSDGVDHPGPGLGGVRDLVMGLPAAIALAVVTIVLLAGGTGSGWRVAAEMVLWALAVAAVAERWVARRRDVRVQRRELTGRRAASPATSERQRDARFLAAVAHELRTPANAIRLQVELLRRSARDPDRLGQVPALAGQVDQSVALLLDLVGDAMDLLRLDAGGVDLRETDVDLDAVLASESDRLAGLAASRNQRLRHAPAPEAIWLGADRAKLERIVRHMLESGLARAGTGEVRVGARPTHDGGVRIEVVDTGGGLAPEAVRHLFDEIVQLGSPEHGRRGTSALGLAVSKRLVDLLGGRIEVESAIGRGTRMVVLLPATMTRPTSSVERRHPGADAPALAGVRILLAEDHDPTRAAFRQLLRSEGAVVTEARDGIEALAALEAGQPQVMLLDLAMPRLDGVGVLRRLRHVRPPTLVSIVVISGDRRAQDPGDIRALGADAVISKPIDPSRLLGLLRDVTSGRPRSR